MERWINNPGQPPAKMRNLLTFDIEGFIEASHDSMNVPGKYISDVMEREEIESNTLEILDVLSEFKQKATFFILGRIARDMPSLVRQIADSGNEIGCHSFYHRRLFHYSRSEAQVFLADAKRLLENASGKRVYGFRAPDFSITTANLWMFDLLRELGFDYDSSVVPTGLHDVYGIRGFTDVPFRLPNGLIEVPLSTARFAKQKVPFGGGGYLRLYPLTLTKMLFRTANRKGRPCIVYLHPFEMGKVIRKIEEIGRLRKFRTYTGIKGAKEKLRSLLRAFQFCPVVDYLKQTMSLEEVK